MSKQPEFEVQCTIKVVRERWVNDGTWYVIEAHSTTARGNFQQLAAYRSRETADAVAEKIRKSF